MEYKNYKAQVEFDSDNRIFVGSVQDIDDAVLFQGETVAELESDFQEAVDTYLEMCAEQGTTPEKPYSGKLNLRLTSELHREAVRLARQQKRSLNDLILQSLKKYLHSQTKPAPNTGTTTYRQHGTRVTVPCACGNGLPASTRIQQQNVETAAKKVERVDRRRP